jgi:uncharacterized protein YxjI
MSVASFLQGYPDLFIRQRKELVEILVDWEMGNQYTILDAEQNELAYVAEKKGGIWSFFRRGFLRSHRPLEIAVVDRAGERALDLTRPFFFLFSSLDVTSGGRSLGRVERRFGVLYKRYDLIDATTVCFARVKAPRWRLWTFPVEGEDGASTSTISKKWGGVLREAFTDADTYRVEFGDARWTEEQRAVILAAAISIDFDFFENNQGSGGVLDFKGNFD